MIASILIVDDETTFLNSAGRMLRMSGYTDFDTEADPTAAAEAITKKEYDVAFLDITMPGMDGMELLTHIKEHSPQTECIMITANQEIPTVIKAVKLGAYDYLVKPIQPDQMIHSLKRALERKHMMEFLMLRREEAAEKSLDDPEAFAEIMTCNEKMLRLLREVELHARSDIAVLVTGETGAGKELTAQALHKAGNRKDGPFVAVNMLSLSAGLFESEFFGHAKGSFTGALQDKEGYLARAEGGTLFLDEIGDLPMEIQGKLLRILQEGEYTPVGKTRPKKADVRFVAATNQDLEQAVQEGRFRKDLYYRLRFAHLRLPPLRERKDDIRLLSEFFLRKADRGKIILSDEAEKQLLMHDWPGNIRELKGVLEAAVNLAAGGIILPEHLNLPQGGENTAAPAVTADGQTLEPMAEVERRHILHVYHALEDNKTRAAKVLGISLATLQRKLKSYGVK